MLMRNLFLNECVLNNLVFTEIDYLNFCKACNEKPEKLNFNVKESHYVAYKNLLGPCIFHPRTIKLQNVDYNISKLITELKLNKQSILPAEKMKKIIDYVVLLG